MELMNATLRGHSLQNKTANDSIESIVLLNESVFYIGLDTLLV